MAAILSLYQWVSTSSSKITGFILSVADNWYVRQIESFKNVAKTLDRNSDPLKLSTIIWRTQSLLELEKEIYHDLNACKEQLLMIHSMFIDMGLNNDTALQCLRQLIETNNIPVDYIRLLCSTWHKYKIYSLTQEDLFDSPVLIHQNKQALHTLFRYLLKPLLGFNEEKEIVLKEHFKHQADISKALEIAILTETAQGIPLLERNKSLFNSYEQLNSNSPSCSSLQTIIPDQEHVKTTHKSRSSSSSKASSSLQKSLIAT